MNNFIELYEMGTTLPEKWNELSMEQILLVRVWGSTFILLHQLLLQLKLMEDT